VSAILKVSLDPAKDVQLRTRFLLLIPELFSSATTAATGPDGGFIAKVFDDLITDMMLPNVVWRAGRANSSARMTATASLVLILQLDLVRTIRPKQETLDSLFKTILACLDDDNKSTRFYACKIFLNVLSAYGDRFDRDQLHKLYPEFIKRLDDQSEEIRFEIIKVFGKYCACLGTGGPYDKVLYQAHLQTIDENLILYLDDSNLDIQFKINGDFQIKIDFF
jgi:dynein assembly factor 5